MENARRSFLKKGIAAGISTLLIPGPAKATMREQSSANAAKIALKKNAVVLFQGDSITDSGRDRASADSNSPGQLGHGYPLFAATSLLENYADKQLQLYNKGISGNKVYQLRERWEADCLSLKPDVVSILIGVNDYWHTLNNGYKGTVQTYENDYRKLLYDTKEQLPDVQLVIGEPFVLRGGSAIESESWFPMFDEYRAVARKLADELKAVFVPYQAGFEAAMALAPVSYWSGDGVHPDLPGRQLMANLWLEATGLK